MTVLWYKKTTFKVKNCKRKDAPEEKMFSQSVVSEKMVTPMTNWLSEGQTSL